MDDVAPFLAFLVTATMCSVGFIMARAWAHRLRGPTPPQVDPKVIEELEDLRAQVAQLQGQMDEVLDRQDFSERMLAQARERGLLGSGQ